jgi:hypothetical protein
VIKSLVGSGGKFRRGWSAKIMKVWKQARQEERQHLFIYGYIAAYIQVLYMYCPVLLEYTRLGLPSEFRSEKIPRNRLGTVFVIPRNKVLIPCGSEYFGRVHSVTRNKT